MFLQLIDPRELKGGVKKMGRPIPFHDFTGVLKELFSENPVVCKSLAPTLSQTKGKDGAPT